MHGAEQTWISRKQFMLALLALFLIGTPTGAAAQQAYSPGPHNVRFPAEFRASFVRYTTIEKPDRNIVRMLYVNREALAGAAAGAPLPNGTIIVMEDRAVRIGLDGSPERDAAGRLVPLPDVVEIHVQEKRTGWGVGYPDSLRNGAWEYARFRPDGRQIEGPVEACFACHKEKRSGQDFTFSLWDFVKAIK